MGQRYFSARLHPIWKRFVSADRFGFQFHCGNRSELEIHVRQTTVFE
ncbi:hypothetical protein SFHH103_03336 [Sinorhizobium fredii HH103]|uniref:Uncharacterized protein n=1 Tax=Sinorhizobium fredii (strain HH103) TaxID=1117943 RepID=G9A380_SINF1|nr:hypothetical protein SFHH103_03336 [Sinorhizobium fredii HH103]